MKRTPGESKRPAFQFYPGDWLRDVALRRCSPVARALWIDLLCLMHDGEPYGHLRSGGADMAPAEVARATGFTPAEVRRALAELERAGVFSQTSAGTIYSRRMVRDETLREKRAAGGPLGGAYGALGGRPKKPDCGDENDTEGVSEKPLAKPHESEKNNPPAVCSLQFASAVTKGENHGSLSTGTPRRAQRAAPSTAKTAEKSANTPTADELRAWSDACRWVRDHRGHALSGGRPDYYAGPAMPEAVVDRALESVNGDRLLRALDTDPREVGFMRREFLAAYRTFAEQAENRATLAGAVPADDEPTKQAAAAAGGAL